MTKLFRRAPQILWIVGALLFLIAPGLVRAQPASQPSTRPSSQSSLGPTSAPTSRDRSGQDAADLRELTRALGADKKAKDKAGGAAKSRAASGGGLARTFQSMNPNISLILDTALAAFSTDSPLQSGAHDPREDGFNLQQLEMAIYANVDPYFRFDANLVFSENGVEVEEAYGTTLALPWNLQLRAGQFLTRFGRINNTHPHSWFFVDQPIVIGKFFGAEGNRGLGAELSWMAPLPWYVELVGSATDAGGAATARSFFGAENLGVDGPGDFELVGALKQFFPLSANWSLMWGLSAATGPNATGRDNRTNIYGTDIFLKYRPISYGSYIILSLDVEWLLRRRQVPLDVFSDHGLYAYLFFRFARRWAVAARYEYVSGVEGDYLDAEWTGLRQRASGNITFWPTEFSRLRLQYNYDRPSWGEAYHAVFLALELVVGAHGAHRF